MTSNEQKRSALGVPNRDPNAAARVVLALKLRRAKLSWESIAKQCGYNNESSVRKAVKHEMDRIVSTAVKELRAEELAILDNLHTECWALAMDRNNKARLFAVDRVLEISKDRRKLMNLDVTPEENVNNNITVVREIPAGYLEEPKVE